jgi:hypothetical protein
MHLVMEGTRPQKKKKKENARGVTFGRIAIHKETASVAHKAKSPAQQPTSKSRLAFSFFFFFIQADTIRQLEVEGASRFCFLNHMFFFFSSQRFPKEISLPCAVLCC